MDIVLASTSPYRKAQLEGLGIEFKAHAPAIDEEKLKTGHKDPKTLCEFLAQAKAQSLLEKYPNSFIIGSDQLVDFNGETLGKPGTTAKAVDQLEKLSGQSHRLITSVFVQMGEKTAQHTDITELTMRSWSREELQQYVGLDQPVDCAGAYKLESKGLMLFSKILSADHSAIIGLPLLALTDIMLQFKIPLPFQTKGAQL